MQITGSEVYEKLRRLIVALEDRVPDPESVPGSIPIPIPIPNPYPMPIAISSLTREFPVGAPNGTQ